MKEIKNKTKISLTTIFSVVFLFVILIVSLTVNGNNKSQTNTVNSYLSSNGNATGTINVAGVQLKVYQKTNDSSEYVDVTDTGFDLYYPYFVTDKKYNYDLIIKNDETAEVTADQYYLRWNFTAIIDNQEYDITDYCKVDSAYVYKQEDTDGKTRF